MVLQILLCYLFVDRVLGGLQNKVDCGCRVSYVLQVVFNTIGSCKR